MISGELCKGVRIDSTEEKEKKDVAKSGLSHSMGELWSKDSTRELTNIEAMGCFVSLHHLVVTLGDSVTTAIPG